jgi:hypothetical protein
MLGAFPDPKPLTKLRVYRSIAHFGEGAVKRAYLGGSGGAAAKITYELVIRLPSETRWNRTTGKCVWRRG